MTLRRRIVSALLAACVAASLIALPAAAAGTRAASADTGYSSYEWNVLKLTNKERAANGVQPQTMFPTMQRAAHIRAAEVAEYFSHTRPDGTRCFTVCDDVGLSYNYIAENIAAGQSSPGEVVNSWINSSGHHANMIDPNTIHTGVGYKAAGDYGTSWVQLFLTDSCSISGISVETPSGGITVPVGTSIDDMGAVLHAACTVHGDSYCPLISELCSGYDSSRIGTQTVTVSAYGRTASFNVTVSKASVHFSDVSSGDWYYSYVADLSGKGILTGTANADGSSSFRPNGSITRSEFAAILARASGEAVSAYAGKSSFYDVDPANWASPYIEWANANGIASGSSGAFRPQAKITRQEMAAMIFRFSSHIGKALPPVNAPASFTDAASIASWAVQPVRDLQIAGIIGGIANADGTYRFNPLGSATRAEAAKMISVLLSK